MSARALYLSKNSSCWEKNLRDESWKERRKLVPSLAIDQWYFRLLDSPKFLWSFTSLVFLLLKMVPPMPLIIHILISDSLEAWRNPIVVQQRYHQLLYNAIRIWSCRMKNFICQNWFFILKCFLKKRMVFAENMCVGHILGTLIYKRM